MTVQEAIKHCEETAKEKYTEGMLCHANPDDGLLDGCIKCAKEHEQLAEWLKELEQYRALGTMEELKEAMEKPVAKKPIEREIMSNEARMCCPNCGASAIVNAFLLTPRYYPCCPWCGQKLGEEGGTSDNN